MGIALNFWVSIFIKICNPVITETSCSGDLPPNRMATVGLKGIVIGIVAQVLAMCFR